MAPRATGNRLSGGALVVVLILAAMPACVVEVTRQTVEKMTWEPAKADEQAQYPGYDVLYLRYARFPGCTEVVASRSMKGRLEQSGEREIEVGFVANGRPGKEPRGYRIVSIAGMPMSGSGLMLGSNCEGDGPRVSFAYLFR